MAGTWYRTGTLTLTQGSAEVSGDGTAFLANVRAGDMLIGPIMDMYEVTAVISDSRIRLAANYAGATYTGTDWSIAPTSAELKRLAQEITALVAIYQDIPETATTSQAAARQAQAAATGAAASATTAKNDSAAAASSRDQAAGGANAARTSADAARASQDVALAAEQRASIAAQTSSTAAAEAVGKAEEVRGIAQQAKDGAAHAVQVAEGVDGKAQLALANANSAVDKANSASMAASQAVTTASESNGKAQSAFDTATASKQRVEQVNSDVNAKILPALAATGRIDLSVNPVITGPLTGVHAATALRFRTSGQGADASTYVAAVPGAGGSLAGFIARSAEQADSAFVTLTCSPTAANVTFSRHGAAAAPQMLTFTSASTECGRVDQWGNWTFGTRPTSLAASTKAVLHYQGGGQQWGLLMAPDINDGAAVAFQNSVGGLVGSITTTATSTAYNTASDYRLKQDVHQIPPAEALDSIMALAPKTYVWRQTGEIGEGFIAHELQAEVPAAVFGEKDDPNGVQSVNYSYLVPRLVAAIQGAVQRVLALEVRLAEIEAARASAAKN